MQAVLYFCHPWNDGMNTVPLYPQMPLARAQPTFNVATASTAQMPNAAVCGCSIDGISD